MIFEYMAYGDLTDVLRNSSEQFMNYSRSLPLLDRVSVKRANDGVTGHGAPKTATVHGRRPCVFFF